MEKNNLLSDYEIGEVIGTGTFSIVKLAINKITKEKVAIKFYRKIESENKNIIQKKEIKKSKLEKNSINQISKKAKPISNINSNIFLKS